MAAEDTQTAGGIYSAAAISIAVIMFAAFARNYYLRAWMGHAP